MTKIIAIKKMCYIKSFLLLQNNYKKYLQTISEQVKYIYSHFGIKRNKDWVRSWIIVINHDKIFSVFWVKLIGWDVGWLKSLK